MKEYDVVVVGTGAAGYNAANRIMQERKKSVCIVTEGINMGTSRNTGSDKQTYYKLGLGGDTLDSIDEMANNLFACGSVDGDNALCEAALSARCFMNLVELGVPFPASRYGEFVGYKTDHDPYARATSAGPLTSKYMTEALQKKSEELHVPVFDDLYAIELLKDDDGICGILCLNKSTGEYIAFQCEYIILATGGPAAIYADSVYPECHTGSTGLAIECGASLQNMTEWQYGLASVNPRWNVSGTYMQVIPRFISIDKDGNEYEFLSDYFEDKYEAMSTVFLKGYQWPFDSKKVLKGSSVIDLLVYRECVLKQRRVYLDFTENPFGIEKIEFEKLSGEAYDYLAKAKSLFGTPIDRLKKMNTPAIELYKKKGIDITKEYLEIALCAQHHNGGIAVDMWWQTSVKGLFCAGECAGTHGVTRPGGSALNAGQVGSLRAAQYVSNINRTVCEKNFSNALNCSLAKQEDLKKCVLNHENNILIMISDVRRIMSDVGGAIRNQKEMIQAYGKLRNILFNFHNMIGIENETDLWLVYMLKSILLTQCTALYSMIDFSKTIGKSRGSALYTDKNGKLREKLEEIFRFIPEEGFSGDKIQQIAYSNGEFVCHWRKTRPIPKDDLFFENVWSGYRKNRNIM